MASTMWNCRWWTGGCERLLFRCGGSVSLFVEHQTDSYSLSQAVYLSIRFRAEGLVCAITSKKSAVVTVPSWMARMSASPVEDNHSEAEVLIGEPYVQDCACVVIYHPYATPVHQKSYELVSWRPPCTPIWYQSPSIPPSPVRHHHIKQDRHVSPVKKNVTIWNMTCRRGIFACTRWQTSASIM